MNYIIFWNTKMLPFLQLYVFMSFYENSFYKIGGNIAEISNEYIMSYLLIRLHNQTTIKKMQ